MKSRISAVTALVARLTAPLALAQPKSPPPEAELDLGDYEAGQPVLAYPLHTRKAPPHDDYTVIEEAQEAKKVSIRELDSGGATKDGGEKKMFRARGKAVHGTFFGAKKGPATPLPSTRVRAPEQEQQRR